MDALDLNEDSFLHFSTSTKDDSKIIANNNKKWSEKVLNDVEPESKIRSSAIVTYSSAKYPALFSQLAPCTNLNLAPSNWLRRTPGLRPNIYLSGGKQSSSYDHQESSFSSFNIANSHLDIMGNIDVVSDAENIKKLLKVPYSKANISMAVHRAGRTLLLEKFDLTTDKTMEPGRSVSWFKDVYEQATSQGSLISSKKKLPSAQLDRLMLSKFLYYSIKEHQENKDVELTKMNNVALEDLSCLNSDSQFTSETIADNMLVPQELRWKYWTPTDDSTATPTPKTNDDSFEKTILWTFEDLQMLLGTNMPVFGEGKYPAVSLRLRDSNKPINVLTGIDYWLDNLICNVPELHMCFHLDGFVQNYEVIKTEEIPKLQHSKFSPKVIKDIAQNILSFLKSNCTKEGHTYWLFKGDSDDVVKLYDLTTLCTNTSENKLENPFTFSVSTLIYKMAVNLMQNPTNAPDHKSTIKKLLQNCVKLLESNSHLSPVMFGATLCMLSSLCLPDANPENTKDKKTRGRILSNSIDFINPPGRQTESSASMAVAVIPSVSDLSIPEKYSLNSTSCENTELNDGCHATLKYIVKGMKFFRRCSEYRANGHSVSSNDVFMVNAQLVRNTVLAYHNLATRASQREQYGTALRYVNIALHSYEQLEHLNNLNLPDEKENETIANDLLKVTSLPDFHFLLPKLLSLCGDFQLIYIQQPKLFKEQFNSYSSEDTAIIEELYKSQILGNRYKQLAELSSDNDVTLSTCRNCYEKALNILKSQEVLCEIKKKVSKKDLKIKNDLMFMVTRKLGHIANEQGTLKLKKAHQMLNEDAENKPELAKRLDKEKQIWKESFLHLETALNSFTLVNDNVNQALVLSNLGHLMRICAQSMAQNELGEFTMPEKQTYDKAINYYKKALQIHQNLTERRHNNSNVDETEPSVYDNIRWELCGTYFAMAQRLQDHAPLSVKTQDEIEREVSDLMNKSLKNCADIWKTTVKRPLAVLRSANIHHRLASLHHNTYRQLSKSKKREQIRMLATNHYKKSLDFFSRLIDEHPDNLLRVQLEFIALKEQHAEDFSSSSKKLKVLNEAIESIILCSQPVHSMFTFMKKKMTSCQDEKSNATSVDPLNPDLASINNSQCTKLLGMLLIVIRSLMLAVLKITADVSGVSQQSTTAKQKRLPVSIYSSNNHIKYKDMYSFVIRKFHKISNASNETSKAVTDEQFFDQIEAVLSVLSYMRDKIN